MRVGVDYRILTVGRNLMRRGLGRYTQQQLRAVIEAGSENEYLLFCDAQSDTSLVDPAIRGAENVSIRRLPPAISGPGHEPSTRLQRAEAMQSWLLAQGVDLYHATTPFFPAEPFLATFDACPFVATFYDPIPLLFPDHYLSGTIDRQWYGSSLSLVRRANRVIAISQAAGKDAAQHLGVAAERIDVASPAVDGCFRVMSDTEVNGALEDLRKRAAVPNQFMLTISFPHFTKNLDTLLHAFARLPADVRLRTPLLVCATLSPAASVVWPLARNLGITDDLVFTGPVSEDELTALYNAATLVVHPSRYEGFGLPVVEAMRCGTPVITTTASSLPEVGGDAALLVDPDDVEGMADAMLRVQQDSGQREQMTRRGLAHSATFDLGGLAARTLTSYRAAVASSVGGARRPRVAVWTTVPPQPGVVAEAAGDFLGGPDPEGHVEVFVDDDVMPSWTLLGRIPVLHQGAFCRRDRQAGFRAVVYHLGASAHELFAVRQLREQPGVAVIHRSCSDAADSVFDGVADASLALVTFDAELAGRLSLMYPRVPVRVVPLGVADPMKRWSPLDRDAARAQLGHTFGTYVVGVVAHGDASPVEYCLRALAGSKEAAIVVLGTGPSPDSAYALHDLAERLGYGAKTVLTPPMSETESVARLAGCDVVVSLSARQCDRCRRETMRALAVQTPVVMAQGTLSAPLSGEAWLDLPGEMGVVAHLAAQLGRLAEDPALRRRLADGGRSFFELHATLSHTAAGLASVLHEVVGDPLTTADGVEPADSTWDTLVQALSA